MIVTYSTGDAVYLFNVSDTVVGMQVDCDEDLFAEYYYSVKLPIYRVMQADSHSCSWEEAGCNRLMTDGK